MEFGKRDIIKLVQSYLIEGDKSRDVEVESTLYKRLDSIINFLKEQKVINALNQSSGNFYSEKMTAGVATGEKFENYNFSIHDTIFLAILVSEFDHSLFKLARSKKWNVEYPEKTVDLWIDACAKRLDLYTLFWLANSKEDWITNQLHLQLVLNGIAGVKEVDIEQKRIEQEIEAISYLFETLPTDLKIDFYKKVKSRITFIKKTYGEFIKDLQQNDRDKYRQYLSHKKLVDYDNSLDNDNKAHLKDLLKLIELNNNA